MVAVIPTPGLTKGWLDARHNLDNPESDVQLRTVIKQLSNRLKCRQVPDPGSELGLLRDTLFLQPILTPLQVGFSRIFSRTRPSEQVWAASDQVPFYPHWLV